MGSRQHVTLAANLQSKMKGIVSIKLLSKEMLADYIRGLFAVLYFIFGFVPHFDLACPFVMKFILYMTYIYTPYQNSMLGQGAKRPKTK